LVATESFGDATRLLGAGVVAAQEAQEAQELESAITILEIVALVCFDLPPRAGPANDKELHRIA
jgi:hypothetical protein